MAVFTMSGPFPLSRAAIDSNIPAARAGIFVLGTLDKRGSLTRVERLGRSDADLASELKRLIGKFPAFLFQLAPSATDAFRVECELFHQIRRLDLPHPVRPSGIDTRCPICGASGTHAGAFERAKRYREKSEEARAAAATIKPPTRLHLLELADAYERLAQSLETHVPSDGPNSP